MGQRLRLGYASRCQGLARPWHEENKSTFKKIEVDYPNMSDEMYSCICSCICSCCTYFVDAVLGWVFFNVFVSPKLNNSFCVFV